MSDRYVDNLHLIIDCLEKECHNILNELTTVHGYTCMTENSLETIRESITNFCSQPERKIYNSYDTGIKSLNHLLQAKTILAFNNGITFEADVECFVERSDLPCVLDILDELLNLCIKDVANCSKHLKLLTFDAYSIDGKHIIRISHNASENVSAEKFGWIRETVQRLSGHMNFAATDEYFDIEISFI